MSLLGDLLNKLPAEHAVPLTDAADANLRKFIWCRKKHDYAVDIPKKEFKVILRPDGWEYKYPLKVLCTTTRDSVWWAWDNHPMNWDNEVIYDGALRSVADIDEFEYEQLFNTLLERARDLPGMVYRVFSDARNENGLYLYVEDAKEINKAD